MTKDYDYLVIVLPVEFVPGQTYHAPVSDWFVDKALAKFSLTHIQQSYPKAQLMSFGSVNNHHGQDYIDQLQRTKTRDEYYRKRYLINY